MTDDALTGSLSQNLLTLLVFDHKSIPLLVSTLEPGMFESDFYKHIASLCIDFYREFKVAPAEHIADLLETKLAKQDRESAAYEKILINLYNNKDDINTEYVISQLRKFVRQQSLKDGIVVAHQAIKDGLLDDAENALTKALTTQISIFDPGIQIMDIKNSLGFLTDPVIAYPMGIKQLDAMNFGPAPGELTVLLAPPNRGKTQFCVHIAKVNALLRQKVLIISLEMSEKKYMQRIFQSLFAVSKRLSEVVYPAFTEDEDGRLTGFRFELIKRPTLQDANILEVLQQKLANFHKLNILVKRFPTNSLTIKGLETYLDGLERFHNYTPDLILIDYADLLLLDQSQLRISTGGIYRDLRRIAVERNVAVVSPSQSNRLGEDARVITLKHLSEDYSKAGTADNVIAYCQTALEYKLGLARLFIAKARDEERDLTILISQAYRMAQFCLSSHFVSDTYWSLIEAQGGQSGESNSQLPRPEGRSLKGRG